MCIIPIKNRNYRFNQRYVLNNRTVPENFAKFQLFSNRKKGFVSLTLRICSQKVRINITRACQQRFFQKHFEIDCRKIFLFVVEITSIQTHLAIACQEMVFVQYLIVKSEILHGDVEEVSKMKQAKGLIGNQTFNHVHLLKKDCIG